MKIIIYTLNEDGTIPEYVLDGGYLPIPNDNESPQDWDLIGVATDYAIQSSFENVEKLIEYIQNNNMTFVDPKTKEVTSIEYVAQEIWNKMAAIAG